MNMRKPLCWSPSGAHQRANYPDKHARERAVIFLTAGKRNASKKKPGGVPGQL
jgi:hypothetical protein